MAEEPQTSTPAASATSEATQAAPIKPKKAQIDMNRFLDQSIDVSFVGGRQVRGILKGWDQHMALVLEDAVETLRDPLDHTRLTDKTRKLGRIVCKGASVTVLCPTDGKMEIPNPYLQEQELEKQRI